MNNIASQGVATKKPALRCPRCDTLMSKPDTKAQTRSCPNCDYTLRGTIEQHNFIVANSRIIAEFYYNGNSVVDTCQQFGISSTAFYRLPEIRKHKGELHHLADKSIQDRRIDKRKLQYQKPQEDQFVRVMEKLDKIYILLKGVSNGNNVD